MYDLHRLRLLRELKHRGTLAAVAAALSYSPSTVSQQLAQLEREVGVRLLEPVGRRVRLTPQAEILAGHVEAVLARLERAEGELRESLDEVTGTLRVAAFQTAALALVPAALTALREECPGLRVHVTQAEPEESLPALPAREVDVALAEEFPGQPLPRSEGVEHEELCRDPLRLAHRDLGPPPDDEAGAGGGASAGDGALRSLAGYPWVMEPADTPARRWAVTLCREAGFEPDVRFESSDLVLHARLAERGHAAALLPDLLWRSVPRPFPLHRLPYGRTRRTLITAVRRGGGRQPAVRALRDALRRAATGPTGQIGPASQIGPTGPADRGRA